MLTKVIGRSQLNRICTMHNKNALQMSQILRNDIGE